MGLFNFMCKLVSLLTGLVTLVDKVHTFCSNIAKRKGSSNAGTSDKPVSDCESNQ